MFSLVYYGIIPFSIFCHGESCLQRSRIDEKESQDLE